MDNKKLKELVAAWANSATNDLPFRTAPGNRSVSWETYTLWWSQHNGKRCVGLTVVGVVRDWAGMIKINLIITDDGEYFVVPKGPSDYAYLRDEAVDAFTAKIPSATNPLVTRLELWRQAIIDDIQKLSFSDVRIDDTGGEEEEAYFSITHPEIPNMKVTLNLDHDTFGIVEKPTRTHPLAKMLVEVAKRVERKLGD